MSIKRERSRSFPARYGASMQSTDGGKTWKKFADQPFVMGSQYTEDYSHAKGPDGQYHEGGTFYSVLAKKDFPTKPVQKASGSTVYSTNVGTPISTSWLSTDKKSALNTPSIIRSDNLSDLDELGATAISLINPINPNAQLGVAFGEVLKDGLPRIPGINTWKQRTALHLGVASEFLNAAFGWLPLVGDIEDTAQSIRDGRTILDHYHSGRNSDTHREFAFPIEESEKVLGSFEEWASSIPTGGAGAGYPSAVRSLFGPAKITLVEKTRTRRWFEGSFTYDVPSTSDGWQNALRIGSDADKLFGVTITPDLLWELTPWSWAIDWFSNAGDVISNVSAFELAGLVMRYGYVMEESTHAITAAFTPTASQQQWLKTVPPQTIYYTSKVRNEANPFGFGVKFEGLSTLQTAIAAALGITRLL